MKAPKQATLDAQKELTDLQSDRKTKITLSSGRTVRIGWLRPDTQDKIDELTVEYEIKKKERPLTPTLSTEGGREETPNPDPSTQKGEWSNEYDKWLMKMNSETRKFYAKTAAAILINNYFGLKLRWWLKWRIMHHFWHMSGEDYLKIVSEAKKKAAEQEYYLAMALLMTMPQIWTTMTEKEAEAFRQDLELARKQA